MVWGHGLLAIENGALQDRGVNMATMIPSSVHDDCKSNAERRLFSRLKNELPDSYTVFHSLGIAKHNKKLVAEIDFVIVGNKGILCLEVKGGRISQKSGVWSYTDRYGKVHKKGESPFNQARTAMFGLIASIKSKFKVPSPQAGAAIGYAVVFPDAQFTVESPEWDLKKSSITLPVNCALSSFQPYSSLIAKW